MKRVDTSFRRFSPRKSSSRCKMLTTVNREQRNRMYRMDIRNLPFELISRNFHSISIDGKTNPSEGYSFEYRFTAIVGQKNIENKNLYKGKNLFTIFRNKWIFLVARNNIF